MAEEWLWIAEAARRLGVGVTKMRELVDTRQVKGRRMPGSTYRQVSAEDLERYRREHETGERGEDAG